MFAAGRGFGGKAGDQRIAIHIIAQRQPQQGEREQAMA